MSKNLANLYQDMIPASGHNNLQSRSGKKREEFKVSPDVMQVILMDEIAGRLGEIQKSMNDSPIEGQNDFFEDTATHNPTIIYPTRTNTDNTYPLVDPSKKTGWLSLFIENTGDNKLYFITNALSINSDTPYVSAGRYFQFDPGKKTIYQLTLWTPVGTTTTYKVFAAK